MLKVTDTTGPIKIGIYLAQKFSIVPFINAIDPLRMANRICDERLFEWTFISRDGQPVEAINGMSNRWPTVSKGGGLVPKCDLLRWVRNRSCRKGARKSWLRMRTARVPIFAHWGAGSIFSGSRPVE